MAVQISLAGYLEVPFDGSKTQQLSFNKDSAGALQVDCITRLSGNNTPVSGVLVNGKPLTELARVNTLPDVELAIFVTENIPDGDHTVTVIYGGVPSTVQYAQIIAWKYKNTAAHPFGTPFTTSSNTNTIAFTGSSLASDEHFIFTSFAHSNSTISASSVAPGDMFQISAEVPYFGGSTPSSRTVLDEYGLSGPQTNPIISRSLSAPTSHVAVSFTVSSASISSGTIPTVANGNWSNPATWSGSVVPGNGNIVFLGHHVTVDIDAVIGQSGPNGTYAISMSTNNRILTINPSASLTLRGDYCFQGSYANKTDVLTMKSGSMLVFDSSLASTPTGTFYRTYPKGGGMGASIAISGTADVTCSVRSNVSGGNGYFDRPHSAHGQFFAYYTDFTNIGDDTRHFYEVQYGDAGISGQQKFIADNCILSGTGRISVTNQATSNTTWSFQNSTMKGTRNSTSMVIPVFTNNGFKSLSGSVFDNAISWANGNWYLNETYFFEGVNVGGGMSVKAVLSGSVFIRKTTQPTINGWGDLSGSYYLKDTTGPSGHFDNVHFWAQPGWADCSVIGNIFEYNGSGTNGDTLSGGSPSSARSHSIERNIWLPNASGSPLGKSFSVGGMNGSTSSSFRIKNNTFYSDVGSSTDTETGFQYGETGGSAYQGMITLFANNLAISSNANRALLLGRLTNNNSVRNIAYTESILNNATWNGYSGTDGIGYDDQVGGNAWTLGTPGGADIVIFNNPFVDMTRNMKTWDLANGGPGTYQNALAEMAKRNDRSGYNPSYSINSLMSHVQSGWVVTDPALQNAGYDGTTIGAMEFQGSEPMPSGSNIVKFSMYYQIIGLR